MVKKRPVGLTIIGTLFIIGSILTIVGLFSPRFQANLLAIIISFAYILFGLYVGIGILMFKPPARLIAIVFMAVRIPVVLVKSFKDFNILVTESSMPKYLAVLTYSLTTFLIVGIAVWIVYYLTRPKIKEEFKQ